METNEILNGNKLIAKFMGLKTGKELGKDRWQNDYFDISNTINGQRNELLLFDTSWDWLMPVVEKIEFHSAHLVEIGLHSCTIKNVDLTWVHTSQGNSKIEAVWLACVEFIKWHNEQ